MGSNLMKTEILPFENLLKCFILAGRDNMWIKERMLIHGISLNKDDIEFTSTKLKKIKAAKDMIAENSRRISDREETYIDKKLIIVIFSRFTDDAEFLIDSFHENENSDKFIPNADYFLNFLKYPKLLTKVINTLLTYCHSSVLEDIFEMDESLTENEGNISSSEMKKFQYFIFNTLKYSQCEISKYLKNENNFKNLQKVFDLLHDDALDFLHQSEAEKLMFINENNSIFRLLSELDQFLNNNSSNFHYIVNTLKIKKTSWQNMLKNYRVNVINKIFSSTNLYHEPESSVRKNKYNSKLFVPFYNFIKLLLYSGFEIEAIKSFFDATWHNEIPIERYQQILKECESSKEGLDLISENQKQHKKKNHKKRKTLIRSKTIRESFQFPEILDRINKENIKLTIEDILPFESIDINNRDVVQTIEVLLTGNASVGRIIECLRDEFSLDITEKDIKIFRYFMWNLKNLDSEKEVFEALFDYFYLDPDNNWFEPHQNVILRGLNHTLFTMELINLEELEIYLEELMISLNSKIGDSNNAHSTSIKSKHILMKKLVNIIDDIGSISFNKMAQKHIDESRRIIQVALGIDKDDYYIQQHKEEKLKEILPEDIIQEKSDESGEDL